MCALVLMLGGAKASAQDAGAVGVSMGYPSAVGVMWHVAERFAIRPEVSFSASTNENPITSSLSALGGGSSTTSVSSSTAKGVGVGISGLFYIGKWDALRAYVAPRFVYAIDKNTSEFTTERFVVNPGPSFVLTPMTVTTTSRRTLTGKSASGLFGASYSLHKRFSVFGEAGFGYETLGLSSTSTPSQEIELGGYNARTWNTRTAAGAIFYF